MIAGVAGSEDRRWLFNAERILPTQNNYVVSIVESQLYCELVYCNYRVCECI
jgi:hypothetical protein